MTQISFKDPTRFCTQLAPFLKKLGAQELQLHLCPAFFNLMGLIKNNAAHVFVKINSPEIEINSENRVIINAGRVGKVLEQVNKEHISTLSWNIDSSNLHINYSSDSGRDVTYTIPIFLDPSRDMVTNPIEPTLCTEWVLSKEHVETILQLQQFSNQVLFTNNERHLCVAASSENVVAKCKLTNAITNLAGELEAAFFLDLLSIASKLPGNFLKFKIAQDGNLHVQSIDCFFYFMCGNILIE